MKKNTLLGTSTLPKKTFTKVLLLLICLSASHSFAQISGVVFRDFDLNGKRTLSNPVEVGAKNVTIRAYVGSNTTAISTTSNPDGTYQFSAAQIPAGSKVRLEFDDLGDGYFDSFFGSDNKSTVQFVTAPQTDVNLGINYPSDYCDSAIPTLVLPCFVNGDPLGGGSAGDSPVLVAVPYDAQGVPGDANYPTVKEFADAKQIGAVWATCYQRTTSTLFTAAFVKRHAGLGPLGIGGIYQTNINSGITTNFVDLTTLGINFGTDPHKGISPDKLKPSHDSLTMDAIGKIGIGGMALSHNQEKLYVVNNLDKKIYSIQVGVPAKIPTAADVQSFAIPNPGCPNNDYRPGAIKEYHDRIYVGVVCSGETTQDTTELKGTIYEFSQVDGSFTNLLSFPLNFRKGKSDYTQSCIKYDSWRAWTNKFPQPCAIAGAYADGLRYFVMYPQPMITSLAFDDDGSMLVGFTDRFGHQSGRGNWSPTSTDTTNYYDGFQGGDVLRAYNNNGTYVLESNGTAGNLTGCGANSGQGPGGGQFYCDTKWIYQGHVAHDAIAGGGLTILPGSGEVLATAFDPIDEIIQAGGLRVWNTQTGERNRAFVLYRELPGSFGKAAGLGDIVVGCKDSPLEIGNRVWYDVNINGIQDPDEAGIDGVILSIIDLDNGNIEVGRDTTANGGQYYFNDKNVSGGLKTKHNYQIQIDINQGTLKNNQYYALSPKQAKYGSNPPIAAKNSNNLRTSAVNAVSSGDSLRDSDGQLVGNLCVLKLQTGGVGETNHSYDIGLVKCVKPDAGKDLAICPPISTADFLDAGINQKWRFLSGPAIATIDSLTGIIKNMTAAGDYQFVLTLTPAGLTCSDTVKITRKIQPDAGIDQTGNSGLCFPISTAKLLGSPAGGTWFSLPSNSPLAQVDINGNVTGMTKIGIYGFVYSLNGCLDTVKVEIKNCCQKPNAGQDLTYCMPNPTANLGTVLAGQKWEFLSGVVPAAIDSVSGKVSGMTSAGVYQFLLYYKISGKTCADTVQITLTQKPDAGIDQTGNLGFCSPISTAKLSGIPAGGSWFPLPTNSPLAQVDANGNVTGMTKIGIYGFVYSLNGCSDTVKVEIKACAIGSLGDFVWYDLNKNGLQDANEPGVNSLVVQLYKLDNLGNTPALPMATTATDIFGKYHFSNLVSGNYRVLFGTPPTNFKLKR